MAVNSILRPGAEALIPGQRLPEIWQGVIEQSVVLNQFTRIRDMTGREMELPILDNLPVVYWVNGDTGLKQTTSMEWDKKKIIAEELAVFVPIPENVLDDARDNGYDLWAQIQPRLIAAMGKAIDLAVIFGIDKPPNFRKSIVDSARETGHIVTPSGDLFGDIMGPDGLISKVEESGYFPNAALSAVRMRGKLRNLRDDTGQPIFKATIQGTSPYELDGMGMNFVRNGSWQDDIASMIIGDMTQAIYSIRQEISFKLFTESVIQNPDGSIAYNLPQQDMVALRVKMRLGWELPNPINELQPDRAKRFPFAVYEAEDGGLGL